MNVFIENKQHSAIVIYKGSITQCCKFEALLDNFMDEFGDENPSSHEVRKLPSIILKAMLWEKENIPMKTHLQVTFVI